MRSPVVIAVSLILASLAWALALVFGSGPFAASAAALLAIDLLLVGTVIAVGVVLSRGRWTRRAGSVLLGAEALLSVFLGINGWWIGAVVTTAASIASFTGPWLGRWLRKLPSAAGPSPRAVALALSLLAVPGLVAASSPGGVTLAGWVLSGFAVVSAWSYSRAWLTALWAIRTALPILGIIAAVGLTWPGGLALGLGVVMLTALAWAPDVLQAALIPRPTRVNPVAIPPELIPRDVLDAAGLDDRGRPHRRGDDV
jgi:hypothetical protein